MSTSQNITQFFANKFLEVPKYQRSYAWERQNVIDLFNDIKEALETKSSHYVGTFVLAKTDKKDVFNIVDGQQRLTTIVMFISVIISFLKNNDDKSYYKRYYIGQSDALKLLPLERDRDFYRQILANDISSEPISRSQKNLLNAHEEMRNILSSHVKDPLELLNAIGELSILEFVEEKESDAIRIFQTVNDRGRDLSRMDKIKSLLYYFSNKHLSGKHDEAINNSFGQIFELYDSIKSTGETQEIDVISSKQFSEDDLLRHHHICFSEESFEPTSQQVFENVKSKLIQLRNDKDVVGLDAYIFTYTKSLLEYATAFNTLVGKSATDACYYKLFSVQGISAVYYPVITQLEKNSLLEEVLPIQGMRILDLIEIIDVRVFKVRDYAGKKFAAKFAYNLNQKTWTLEKIEEHLHWFNSNEISNDKFRDYLSTYEYHRSTGLLRTLFIDYCERIKGKKFTLEELKKLMRTEPTIEHILSQTPKFKPRAFGFANTEDFENKMHLIGNLTILEKSTNSAIKNSDLVEKLKGYGSSKFKMTSMLATDLTQSGGSFKKNDLDNRSRALVDDFSKRWCTTGQGN